jgi:aryl-alcohol dehydrogenase-like predicted oxidoreductase
LSHSLYFFVGVIPLGGARDAKQAEQNAGALGWRLTNEEIAELESHHVNPNVSFFNRLWQHG